MTYKEFNTFYGGITIIIIIIVIIIIITGLL